MMAPTHLTTSRLPRPTICGGRERGLSAVVDGLSLFGAPGAVVGGVSLLRAPGSVAPLLGGPGTVVSGVSLLRAPRSVAPLLGAPGTVAPLLGGPCAVVSGVPLLRAPCAVVGGAPLLGSPGSITPLLCVPGTVVGEVTLFRGPGTVIYGLPLFRSQTPRPFLALDAITPHGSPVFVFYDGSPYEIKRGGDGVGRESEIGMGKGEDGGQERKSCKGKDHGGSEEMHVPVFEGKKKC